MRTVAGEWEQAMSITETVIEGTIQADGTLVLDEKPNLPPGRVTLVVRQETRSEPPQLLGDDFFQMMEEIWAGQNARGHVPRTEAEVEAERRERLAGWAKRQQAIEQLQEESRRLREEAEARKQSP
jgi:hypothetical protein